MGQVVQLKQRNESGVEQVFPRTIISAVEGLEGYSDLNKKVKTLEQKELGLEQTLEQISINLETASQNSSNNKYRIDNLSKDVSSLNANSEQFNHRINSANNSIENLNTELNILDTNCQSELNRIKNSILQETNSRVENISDLQSQIDSHSENISKIEKEIPDVVKSIDAKIDDVGNLVIDFKTVGNKNTPISINNVKTVHYLSEEYHPGEAPFNGVEIGHVVCVKKDAYVYSKGDPIAAIWVNGETEVYTDTNVVLQTPANYESPVFWDPYLNQKIGIEGWRLEEDGKGIHIVNDAFSEDVPQGNYYFKEYYSKTYKELLLKAGIYIKDYRGFIEIKDITANTIQTVLGKSLNDSLTSLDNKIESIQIPNIDVEGDAYIYASASEHNVTIAASHKVKNAIAAIEEAGVTDADGKYHIIKSVNGKSATATTDETGIVVNNDIVIDAKDIKVAEEGNMYNGEGYETIQNALDGIYDTVEAITVSATGDDYVAAEATGYAVTVTTSQKVKDVADAYADGTIAKKEDLPKINLTGSGDNYISVTTEGQNIKVVTTNAINEVINQVWANKANIEEIHPIAQNAYDKSVELENSVSSFENKLEEIKNTISKDPDYLKPLIDEKIDNISYDGVKDDTSIDQKYIDITYSKGETTNHIEILREDLVTVIDVPNVSNVKGLITYNQSNYIDSLPNKLSEYNNRISYNENLCSSLNSTFTDEINNINTTLETLINKPGYIVVNCIEINLQEVINECNIGSIIEVIPEPSCYSWVNSSGKIIYTKVFDRTGTWEGSVYKDRNLLNKYIGVENQPFSMSYEERDGEYCLKAFDILSPELPDEKFMFREHILETMEQGIYIKTQSKGLVKIISL